MEVAICSAKEDVGNKIVVVEFEVEMELFTLTITRRNYLDYLDINLSIYARKGKSIDDWFLLQLKKLCRIIPEFTRRSILCNQDGAWCYDSEHFWEDDLGRCSVRLYNSYFGFNDKVNKFECIRIDYESFGIEQTSDFRIKRLAGVPISYLSSAEQKLIHEQQIDELKRQRTWLIDEIEAFEKG